MIYNVIVLRRHFVNKHWRNESSNQSRVDSPGTHVTLCIRHSTQINKTITQHGQLRRLYIIYYPTSEKFV